jgi:3-oxoacyl-[acyl-carrier protein] reductase
VRALPAEALALRVDVSCRAAVEALVASAVRSFERLDVMANVAGNGHESPLLDTAEADLDRVLAVNLKGVWFGCQAAGAVMARQGSGSIASIASSAAFEPYPTLGAYSVSKAGVVALTRVLAAELGRSGVRVNAIAPGMIDTPMAARAARRPDGTIDPARREAIVAWAKRRSPLGRAGRPEDVALAVLYLASDAARYVTGQVLHVNGGVPMV